MIFGQTRPWRYSGFESSHHPKKASITIKRVPGAFWFPSAHRSSVYALLLSIKQWVVASFIKKDFTAEKILPTI